MSAPVGTTAASEDQDDELEDHDDGASHEVVGPVHVEVEVVFV